MLVKTGPHIQRPTHAAKQWASIAPIVKCVDFPELLDAARPGAITIFRASERDEPEKDQLTPLDFFLRTLTWIGPRYPDYVETQNEWKSHLPDYADRIAWDKEFVGLCHSRGLKVIGPNWAFGAYDEPEVRLLKQNNFCGFDAISLHEYGPLDGWHALRYRKFHDWCDGQHPPIIISEAGLVDATDINWLAPYDAELAKDDYVLGCCIFGAGSFPDWIARGYDYDAHIEDILKLYGEEAMTDIPINMSGDPRIEQLLNQNAELTAALIAHLKGNDWQGADSTAGHIIALTGKSLAELGLIPPKV